PEGGRQSARRPDLARRRRLPARLPDRHVARRAGAAPARPPHAGARGASPRMSAAVALTLAALIAFGAAVFVAQPFLRRPQQGERELQPESSPRLALLERRDRALAALKELEFDHRTGKIADRDYRVLLGPLRGEAAEALRLLG